MTVKVEHYDDGSVIVMEIESGFCARMSEETYQKILNDNEELPPALTLDEIAELCR